MRKEEKANEAADEESVRIDRLIIRLRAKYAGRPGMTVDHIFADLHRRGFWHVTRERIDETLNYGADLHERLLETFRGGLRHVAESAAELEADCWQERREVA